MNRKQVKALEPGQIVKARKGKSGNFFEFEVVSNEIVEWAGTWIKVRALAWPGEYCYGRERPPMLEGEKTPHLRDYRPTRENWETGKEVFIDTRYLRDVEADAERARHRSVAREAERAAERAKQEAFDERRRAWRRWLEERGALEGNWDPAQLRMTVRVSADVAEYLIGEMALGAEIVMTLRVDERGDLADFPGMVYYPADDQGGPE